jgi:Protein of unknown function (DUF669)
MALKPKTQQKSSPKSGKARDDEDEDEDQPKSSSTKSKSSSSTSKGKSSREDDDDDDVIDFSDTEEDDGEFELIKPGRYEAVIAESKYSESKEKGTPMITFTFEVEGGDYNGRKLWYRIFFTPKMAGRLKRDLRVIMGKAPSGAMNKRDFIKLADGGKLIGQRAVLQVVKRKYNDEDRNDVRRILDASDATEEGDGGFMD